MVLNLSAQADARGSTQELGRGGQAAAHGNCLSQVLGRGAEAFFSRHRFQRIAGT
jgi:hypothetical protein